MAHVALILRVPPRQVRRDIRRLLHEAWMLGRRHAAGMVCEKAVYRAYCQLARWYKVHPPDYVDIGPAPGPSHWAEADGRRIYLTAPWAFPDDRTLWVRVALHEFAHHLQRDLRKEEESAWAYADAALTGL